MEKWRGNSKQHRAKYYKYEEINTSKKFVEKTTFKQRFTWDLYPKVARINIV